MNPADALAQHRIARAHAALLEADLLIEQRQEHFVRTGVIPTNTARALPRAFEKRQTSDYGDFSEPSSDEVVLLRDQVRGFVRSCEDVVRNQPPG